MKFGRMLKTTSFDLPEMQALFNAYKILKKQVKRLPYKDQLGQQGSLQTLSEEESNFVTALSQTLHQLNDLFLEKEENSVIRVERLEHELAAASNSEQLNELHKQFVDFHGEVLLLVHWSILAYTATVKILKKHHKRTGLLVRAPQLGNLLSQPFCSTELMTSIAHRVEEDIQRLAERMGVPAQRNSEPTQQQQLGPLQGQQQQQHHHHQPQAPAGDRAAAVAAVVVAAAASAEQVPQLPNGGLDLQLLQQLADSGSITTPSDTDWSKEDDTAHHSGSTKRGLKQQQQQQLQECSQQAHYHDKGTLSEVQFEAKKRRLLSFQESVTGPRPAAAVEDGHERGAAVAAAAARCVAAAEQQQQEREVRTAVQVVEAESPLQQQEQQHEGEEPQQPAAEVAASSQQQQQQQQWCADSAAPHFPAEQLQRCSTTGCAQQQVPVSSAATASGSAACSICARQGTIMRQTQVALTTWQHLQSTASTPSTVVPCPHPVHASPTVLTESSAV